jgi:hypothetical protein
MARVQEKAQDFADAPGGTTTPITLTSAVGSGNLIAGITLYNTALTLNSVTDNQSNSYTIQRTISNGVVKVSTFWRANITNAPQTITANLSGTASYRGIACVEFSGRDTTSPLDGEIGQSEASPGTGTDGCNSTTIVTTVDGDDIFGCVGTYAQRLNSYSLGTNFTNLAQAGKAGTPYWAAELAVESRNQSTQGTIEATFTQANADAAVTHIMAFKPVAAGSPTLVQSHFRFRNDDGPLGELP